MMRNNFLLSALLVIGFFCGVHASTAQLPPFAPPLIQSGESVFAVGAPRLIGEFAVADRFAWRRDGGAVAFVGQSQVATLKQERLMLLQGNSIGTSEPSRLFIYDLASGRLRPVNRFNSEENDETFVEPYWVGQDLYIKTFSSGTKQSPETKHRLYFFDPSSNTAKLIDETPNTFYVQSSPIETNFLIIRYTMGSYEQHFSLVADGKVFPLPLPTEGYIGKRYDWSRDGKHYLHECDPRPGEVGNAFVIWYEAGTVRMEKFLIDREKDWFNSHSQPAPLLTIQRKKETGTLEQTFLIGNSLVPKSDTKFNPEASLASDETPSFFLKEYALAPSDYWGNSLAPDSSAVVYITHKTLFLRTLVEIKGRKQMQLIARLEERELERIAQTVGGKSFMYRMAQKEPNTELEELTIENCRGKLIPDITDKEVIRRFRWICKGNVIGEVRSKRLRAIVRFDYGITLEKLP